MAPPPAFPTLHRVQTESKPAILSPLQDLFDSTIGRTRECALTYDRNGKHKGVATVVFQAKGDAQKAFKTCASSTPLLPDRAREGTGLTCPRLMSSCRQQPAR